MPGRGRGGKTCMHLRWYILSLELVLESLVAIVSRLLSPVKTRSGLGMSLPNILPREYTIAW
jgi:hypothetical protein